MIYQIQHSVKLVCLRRTPVFKLAARKLYEELYPAILSENKRKEYASTKSGKMMNDFGASSIYGSV